VLLNTCETCRHWEKKPGHFNQSNHSGYGRCVIAAGYAGEPDIDDVMAYATDSEDYEAQLMTKPNFGCVQWEAK
jgi:hypothetical protein